jgi:hypothetical protein
LTCSSFNGKGYNEWLQSLETGGSQFASQLVLGNHMIEPHEPASVGALVVVA